ncbi:MAG: hypothetical protein LBE57_01810 [Methanosarcinales archaeon]|jgi:hypothetical protein|nr:hypothetical protein [Methanosarcinales archaeon]
MTEIASLLPQLLVYTLLLFAAYVLFRQIHKLLKGETGCTGCSSGGGCSKIASNNCSKIASLDKKENELEMVKK